MYGRDSSASTATSYVLEVLGSISRYFQFLIRSVFLSIMLPFVLMLSHSVFCTTYVLLFTYCSLFMQHCHRA
jgi:hypothetical protein